MPERFEGTEAERALCRLEVERALDYAIGRTGTDGQRYQPSAYWDYLAARFGDAPGPKVHQLHQYNADGSVGRNVKCEGCGCVTADVREHICFESCVISELDSMERPKPTPSAPAETLTAVSLVACRCGYAMQAAGRCPRCNTYVDRKGPHPEFDGGLTPAERDFVRTLAQYQVYAFGWKDAPEGVDPGYEMLKAARCVIEEAK